MSAAVAIRIVTVDFYMSSPVEDFDVMYSDFRGNAVPQVPVIRIFGSIDTGQKICLHVHGVFPYLYIPYDGKENCNSLKYQIATNIDKAVNVSFGQAASTAQHVYKITLVSGTPFYGYHVRQHQFFKIFLFNPSLVRKISNMLQSEVILGRLYQPHESHIPYILQFMIDYNLHGMSKIMLRNIQFRTNPHKKQSSCELEADALCEHIINRLDVVEGKLGVNPGIAALWDDEKQRLRDKGEESLIGTCLTLVNSQVEPTKTHKLFKQALGEKLCLTDEIEKNEHNLSVYPAETPLDKHMKHASFIELHSPLSVSTVSSVDDTLDLNATIDEDVRHLYEVLQDLGEKNADDVDDEDSILSQALNEDEERDEEDEDNANLDLSVSMAETTPFKRLLDELSDAEKDDLDTTLIPQIDGQDDGSSEEDSTIKSKTQKKKKAAKYSALPVVLSSGRKSQSQVSSQPNATILDNVKRKLKFHTLTLPETTICEDILDCDYKIGNTEKIYNCVETLPKKDSEADPKLSTAEVYDLETNFKPKEGCSTKLTQTSSSSQSQETQSQALPSQQTQNELKSTLSSLSETKTNSELFPSDHDSCSELSQESLQSVVTIRPRRKPPSRRDVMNSLESLNLPKVNHEAPFYSDVSDVTSGVEIGHSVLRIQSKTTAHLEDYKAEYNGLDACRAKMMPPNVKRTHENIKKLKLSFCSGDVCVITPARRPPTVAEVNTWLRQVETAIPVKDVKEEVKKIYIATSPDRLEDDSDLEMSLTISPSSQNDLECKKPNRLSTSCQITGVTVNNTFGFKVSQDNFQEAKAVNEYQHLTMCSLEVHVGTRGDLKPDPEYDSISAIFYKVVSDCPGGFSESGIITQCDLRLLEVNCNLLCVASEQALVEEFVKLMLKWDPDILLGYETEMLSWGYLLDRSKIIGLALHPALSRIKDCKRFNDDKGLQITGRILLDVWRLLRHEIALQSYTFENIAYHLLHKRVPMFSHKNLTTWWTSNLHRHRTIDYYTIRVEGTLEIVDQLDLVGRTSELARLFGIQFYEVLSRGSQFRVESMMLRLAKPLNFIPVSPSVQQRAKMKAPEFLALILEPESKLYVDPVIVLDFQSLYPSMIIAYNYCFSTCIGKVKHLGKNSAFEFGATQLRISKKRVQKLLDTDSLNFSPCGAAFVKKKIRDGIMPRMLREILETRLMVKGSMKRNKDSKLLQKVLHNRQLGLKLIANVTYGYTAANFSGRMPAVELADSVVSKGRETLQRAIELVENTPEWKAKVVYGDTDSLFVLIPGRTRSEAFEIGEKIAQAVTDSNSDPVKLKLEKIYQPCILQTKKRYVGYMYESPEQTQPTYNAKGIETVRRDGCPAVAKMLEKCLRVLFETKDVSLVKKYVIKQFDKILTNRVSLQDLTFAKEYRGASGYRPGACVPALELARKWTTHDRRSEPRRKERVPYVIVAGPPGLPLIRLVRSPREFLDDPSLRPNAIYYITKVIIPPINRCFNLLGADLNVWFNQMPRKQLHILRNTSPVKKSTISQYFVSNSCAVCGNQTQNSLCEKCCRKPQSSVVVLQEKLRRWETAYSDLNLVCGTCTGIPESVCISLDCPVLYRVSQLSRDVQQAPYVRQVVASLQY